MKRLRCLVFVLAVVSTGCGLLPTTVEPTSNPIPTLAPTEVQIAFAREPAEGGTSEIWIVSVLGESPTNITGSSNLPKSHPAWRPRGGTN